MFLSFLDISPSSNIPLSKVSSAEIKQNKSYSTLPDITSIIEPWHVISNNGAF